MSEFLDAAILGLVEGVTEFLPVSSTGHLLLAEHLLGTHPGEAFNILIQIGPILASLIVFRARVLRWFTAWRDAQARREVFLVGFSFLLTAAGGLVLKYAGLELPETVGPVGWATLLGAFVILGVERRASRNPGDERLGWGTAAAVAAGQLVAAAFPGTSRSGACVMAALLCGLSRPAAVEFSFLVGIPTMLAAGAHEIFGAAKAGHLPDLFRPAPLFAFAVATISAFFVARWLLRYVQTHTFIPFAWYRILLGASVLGLAFLGGRG